MGRHLVLMGLRGAEQGCTVTACFQTLSSPLCLSAVSWAEVTNNIWFLPFPWQSPIYCRLCRCYPRLSLISEEFYGYVQTVDLYYMLMYLWDLQIKNFADRFPYRVIPQSIPWWLKWQWIHFYSHWLVTRNSLHARYVIWSRWVHANFARLLSWQNPGTVSILAFMALHPN